MDIAAPDHCSRGPRVGYFRCLKQLAEIVQRCELTATVVSSLIHAVRRKLPPPPPHTPLLHDTVTLSSPLSSNVSSSLWSLAVDVEGVDALASLVSAEPDNNHAHLPAYWPVDGIVSLVFMILVFLCM